MSSAEQGGRSVVSGFLCPWLLSVQWGRKQGESPEPLLTAEGRGGILVVRAGVSPQL